MHTLTDVCGSDFQMDFFRNAPVACKEASKRKSAKRRASDCNTSGSQFYP